MARWLTVVALLVTVSLGCVGLAQAAPAWLAPLDLSDPGQDATRAQIAFDGVGNAVAVWQRSDGTNQRVQVSTRPADSEVWSTAVDLSAAGRDGVHPELAVDPAGNAVAVWRRSDGAQNRVQASYRPAGSDLWGSPVDLSAAGQPGDSPQVGIDGAGNAIAVWRRFDGAHERIQASFRPAGSGVWQTPVNLSAAGVRSFFPQVAVDPAGNAVAVWYRNDGVENRVQASVRLAGSGVWGPRVNLSAAGQSASGQQVAVDPDGNAIAVWTRSDGATSRAQASVWACALWVLARRSTSIG